VSDVQEIKEQFVLALYDRVLHVSNRFLYQCKTFHITILALEDPSFKDIATQTKQVAEIIKILGHDKDPLITNKADEYCDLMLQIAVAIENLDEVKLSTLVSELERKTGK
jgi:hypothetical protein